MPVSTTAEGANPDQHHGDDERECRQHPDQSPAPTHVRSSVPGRLADGTRLYRPPAIAHTVMIGVSWATGEGVS